MLTLQVAVKVLKLKPLVVGDNYVELSAYIVDSEKWELREETVEGTKTIDKLLEVASEYLVKERPMETGMVLVETESPGLRVVLGEERQVSATTIMFPKPTYLRKIVLYKCKDSKCNVIHTFKPEGQLVVYDGSIRVKTPDFSFLVIECEDLSRVVFPHELSLPLVKTEAEVKKHRKRRKKRSKLARKAGKKSAKK